jgi:hypothetical protein
VRRDLEERLKIVEKTVCELLQKMIDREALEELRASLDSEALLSYSPKTHPRFPPELNESLVLAESRERLGETPEQTQARHERVRAERAARRAQLHGRIKKL